MRRLNSSPVQSRTALLATASLAAALAGCAPMPKLGEMPAPRTAATVESSASLQPATGAAWPAEGWWRQFGDPQLDALIGEGLASSPDAIAALARLRRAAAMAQEAGAARLPRLDVNANAGFDRQSLNNGFPEQFISLLPHGWQDNAQIAASLSYDLDLWGKNRASFAAATSETRAAALDVAQARLALATAIASAYADLARLLDERDVRAAALKVRSTTADLVGAREQNGLENRGSRRQAEAQVATARADLAAADELVAMRRNQLAALVGAGPDRGLAISRPALAPAAGAVLPDGVTTDLVGRRPDVAAARERTEAAAQRIKVARADFYPAVRLSALIGLQSVGIGNLFEANSQFGNAGPAISLPIFHGGELAGRYRGARAGYDESVAAYDKSVIEAYRQVADAVTAQRQVALRLADSRAALAATEEAYHIAQLRYRGGLSAYMDVLTVEDRLLQARLAVSELTALSRTVDISLIRALGGGYMPGAATTHPEDKPL